MEVTGISVAKALEIDNATIVDANIDGSGNLVLETKGGGFLNAGQAVVPLAAWPVHSIYIGATATSPADLLGGGTWERFGQGRVLVSQNTADAEFDTALETGGTKTHALSINEMPQHNHTGSSGGPQIRHDHAIAWERWELTLQSGSSIYTLGGAGGNGGLGTGSVNSSQDDEDHTHSIPNQGGGAAHNNLQPYIVVYMWRRTA